MAIDATTFSRRLRAAQASAREQGIDALFITPGSDLRYLIGYDAKPLERLTCLVVPSEREPFLVAPALELLAAQASPASEIGIEIVTWQEHEDAVALAAARIDQPRVCAVDDHMWAEKLLRFTAVLPQARFVTAGRVVHELRLRKDAPEVEALREAGRAIDRVHAQVPRILRAGRTEREVGRDLADLIFQTGHVSADFVIVASGPNAASPHHEVSDRVIQAGDCVVVDIGGTMPSGYCSDSTRTYAVVEIDPEFQRRYDVLQQAQAAARAAVRPGATCESIDLAARTVLDEAGLGHLFIHRTGHGIGLETHEEPYIVGGNTRALEPGMAFSIEPGFYETGRHGARLEDIVVCTPNGGDPVNHQPRELVVAGVE